MSSPGIGAENRLSTRPIDSGSEVKSSAFLPELAQYLSASRKKYEACLGNLEHSLDFENCEATLRLHYLRFDDSRPKFRELAQVLAQHITYYCITAQRRSKATSADEFNALFLEAARLFRRAAHSGEPGELLLYFLLEAVLGAPQAICKMSLKTNRNDEIKGSDGIHLRWDDERKTLILYFGEAKLYTQLSGALTSAFASMETFHSERAEQHEVFLVSSHFNLLSPEVRDRVCEVLDKQTSHSSYEFCHACFFGSEWTHYGNLQDPAFRRQFVKEFEAEYRNRGEQIHKLVSQRLNEFSHRHLRFEFFYIPFEDVDSFREMFFECLPK